LPRALRTALDELAETRFALRYIPFLAELAEGFCQTGEIANARAAIEQAFERCHRNEEHWYLSELLRIKAKSCLVTAAARQHAAGNGHHGGAHEQTSSAGH
jgi:hypothetical protein